MTFVMATLTKFEDIKAWQKARFFCHEIFMIIDETKLSKDYKLKEQINSSRGSAMDNIAEGFERSGQFEFVNFLSISKGSSGEVRSQLHRGIDQNYFPENTCELIKEYDELASKISGFMKYLNQSEIRGQQFKDR